MLLKIKINIVRRKNVYLPYQHGERTKKTLVYLNIMFEVIDNSIDKVRTLRNQREVQLLGQYKTKFFFIILATLAKFISNLICTSEIAIPIHASYNYWCIILCFYSSLFASHRPLLSTCPPLLLFTVDLDTLLHYGSLLPRPWSTQSAIVPTSDLQVCGCLGLYSSDLCLPGSLPSGSALAWAFPSLICACKNLHPLGLPFHRPLSILFLHVRTWSSESTTLSPLNLPGPPHCWPWIP